MTNADPEEIVRIASDGVTVEKSFDPDDFPVPAIAFSIHADREQPVSVRLADTVPDDVAPENIGFHPKYGAEYWDVVDGSIVFEREFAPGEEYTTVYGLRGGDAERPEKFLSEPRLESVEPPVDSESETDADAAAVASAPDRNGDAASEPDEIETELLDDDEPADAPEPSVSDPETATETEATADEAAAEDAGAEDDDTETDSPPVDDSLLESLTDEIEARDPDDPELAALRDALGMDLTRASVEARIEHLQSTVSDLEAYTDALESFLDENGDAQRLLEETREAYEETEERLDAVESTAEAAADDVDAVEERFDGKIEALRDDVADIEAQLESLSTELSEVVEMRDRLADALGGLAGGPESDAE